MIDEVAPCISIKAIRIVTDESQVDTTIAAGQPISIKNIATAIAKTAEQKHGEGKSAKTVSPQQICDSSSDGPPAECPRSAATSPAEQQEECKDDVVTVNTTVIMDETDPKAFDRMRGNTEVVEIRQ